MNVSVLTVEQASQICGDKNVPARGYMVLVLVDGVTCWLKNLHWAGLILVPNVYCNPSMVGTVRKAINC